MGDDIRKCFIIMPFSSELHYFYLYLNSYLSKNHKIDVSRADEKFEDKSFLDKIVNFIDKSDLIIADITGGNPNVMYELGIAHTKNKRVILLTQNSSTDVPGDIKHFEHIQYKLDDHIKFSADLDKAIRGIFSETYTIYQIAQKYFIEFKTKFNDINLASFDKFRIILGEKQYDLEKLNEERFGLPELLPKIVDDSTDLKIMEKILEYIKLKTKS